ncbi:hypothetical protein C8A05DRAFT_32134 [Staphylotrichum tortipilum]|uniref:Uncharacterized protein n=1 Tax=Staphylotrichum tortipilum TaxID=2831512 RepID=A0AAN6RUN5_9PEZI|nr:hypothetical protein C8A05DRAFT_32134 [Staphylotrichum longicolle]
MAFQQQPTRPVPARANHAESGGGQPATLAPQTHPSPQESQTWVLFTPGTDAGTTTSYLSSVQDDQITPGRSRISDLGSLDTAARSEFNLQAPSEAVADSIVEEDAELDSLDGHLPDFRAGPSPYLYQPEVPHAAPVFPQHDGLGSFMFEAPGVGISAETQERMYAFERFNPNRVRLTVQSFNLAQMEHETEEAQETERNRRIEAWRLEQSQLLLEDIRKETRRRRRQSEPSLRKPPVQSNLLQEAADMSVADEEAADINLSGTEWHEQDEPSASKAKPGLWSRLARKVLCDLMGVDDELLAVLFGEAVPDGANTVPGATDYDSEWQLRMLERISRELGVLVHQMSTHPGAFPTFARVQSMPLPYAGLPVIPETPVEVSEGGSGGQQQKVDDSVPCMPQFQPTAGPAAADARQSEPPTPSAASTVPDSTTQKDTQHTFTQQEWEQDLDFRLIFRYLRSRFSSSRPAPASFSSSASHHATSTSQDVAAKAARVRQHHPLVSHAHSFHHHHHHHHHHHRARPVTERRAFKATTPAIPAAGVGLGLALGGGVGLRHAGGGSCASQSTRRSARRSSMSSRASSRHYWDIGGGGGSIGTGSVVGGGGGMGSWGEV